MQKEGFIDLKEWMSRIGVRTLFDLMEWDDHGQWRNLRKLKVPSKLEYPMEMLLSLL